MRGTIFGVKESFNAFGPVYYKSVISTQSRKTREVVVQPLLDGTFAVRIIKYKIIRILQQSTVTRRKIVSMQEK